MKALARHTWSVQENRVNTQPRRLHVTAAMPLSTELQGKVQAYLKADEDPLSRAHIESLLKEGSEAELKELFGTRLQFGAAS